MPATPIDTDVIVARANEFAEARRAHADAIAAYDAAVQAVADAETAIADTADAMDAARESLLDATDPDAAVPPQPVEGVVT